MRPALAWLSIFALCMACTPQVTDKGFTTRVVIPASGEVIFE